PRAERTGRGRGLHARRADLRDRRVPTRPGPGRVTVRHKPGEGAPVSIDVTRDGGVVTVTVDRPEALNALNMDVVTEVRERLRELGTDEEARAAVLTGAGEKAFIAGADIKLMSTMSVLEARRWGELGHECADLLETMPKPTIAAVNGFALGGGC